MKSIDVIREVKLKANGQWQGILSAVGAEVPVNTHTACPDAAVKTGSVLMIRTVTARLSVISAAQVTG